MTSSGFRLGLAGTSFDKNPLMEAVLRVVDGKVDGVDIAAFSRTGGFQRLRLKPSDESFSSLLALLRDEPFERDLRHLLALWRLGLLTTEPAGAPPLVSVLDSGDPAIPGLALLRRLDPDAADLVAGEASNFVASDEARRFAAEGHILLTGLLPADGARRAADYYERLADAGLLQRGDPQSDRYYAHNDPVGSALLRRLHGPVQSVVGRPLKPTYCYAALYRAGSDLPVHTDRPQCAYTLSLLLDHRPMPADGRCPWPLYLTLPGRRSPVALMADIGGGILFQGITQPHFRERLPDGQRSTVVMLHYVDADFIGSLD